MKPATVSRAAKSPSKDNPPTKDNPYVKKVGSSSVTVYFGQNVVRGQDYGVFTLSYYLGTQRVRRRFSNWDEAREEADRAADKLSKAQHEVLKLSPKETAEYSEAMDLLRPSGISIRDAVRAYVEASKKLPPNQTLLGAVEKFAEHFRDLREVKVRDVVDQFTAQKEKAAKHGRSASDVYIKDIKTRLGRFADAFQCPLSVVTPAQVADFLNGLEATGWTRWNHKRLLRTFFRYAQRQNLYPKNIDPFERDEVEFHDEGEVEIFTPTQIASILKTARPELTPFLALGAFAGLRTAEIQRLDWGDIDLVNKRIMLAKERTKTRSRRIVPVLDNLAAWLVLEKKESGPVIEFANVAKQIAWLVDDLNALESSKETAAGRFVWKHNGLRHSFISYRLAEVMNTAQVALEAGNSETMIFKHYRDIVTKEQAATWFSVIPAASENVIKLNEFGTETAKVA